MGLEGTKKRGHACGLRGAAARWEARSVPLFLCVGRARKRGDTPAVFVGRQRAGKPGVSPFFFASGGHEKEGTRLRSSLGGSTLGSPECPPFSLRREGTKKRGHACGLRGAAARWEARSVPLFLCVWRARKRGDTPAVFVGRQRAGKPGVSPFFFASGGHEKEGTRLRSSLGGGALGSPECPPFSLGREGTKKRGHACCAGWERRLPTGAPNVRSFSG